MQISGRLIELLHEGTALSNCEQLGPASSSSSPRAQRKQPGSDLKLLLLCLSQRVQPHRVQGRDLAQHLHLILPSVAHEMCFFFPCSFPRLSHIPSSVTGMLTAQNKPALILWIIFLCQLGEKKERKKREKKSLSLKEGKEPEA